jgi:hypothetical protein
MKPRAAWLLLCGCSVLNGLKSAPEDAAPSPADAFERVDGELPPDVEVVGVFPAVPSRDLDVLFVIDNSATMIEEQASLAAAFPAFISALQATPGGLPNVHIGVVSSDVGAGGLFAVPMCEEQGDDGRLQNQPRTVGCTPPVGTFIDSAVEDADALASLFSCIAQLGTMGCGFEQHLESMLRALDGRNPGNAGFLRDTAYLAVVLLADEDDCSAADPIVFDPSQMDPQGPLGALSSYRCTEFGILCDGEPIGRESRVLDPAGAPLECEPQGVPVSSEPGYLWHPQHYVDFLRSVKQNPALIFVAAIAGDPEPVEVAPDMSGNAELQPACMTGGGGGGGTGGAAPAVRLRWFVDQFPARNLFTSICTGDPSAALTQIGSLVSSAMGQACLVGPLADPSADPGLQPECRVWDVTDYGLAGETRAEIVPCGGAARPCYALHEDAVACPYDSHLEVEITRDAPPEAGVTVVVECRRP